MTVPSMILLSLRCGNPGGESHRVTCQTSAETSYTCRDALPDDTFGRYITIRQVHFSIVGVCVVVVIVLCVVYIVGVVICVPNRPKLRIPVATLAGVVVLIWYQYVYGTCLTSLCSRRNIFLLLAISVPAATFFVASTWTLKFQKIFRLRYPLL